MKLLINGTAYACTGRPSFHDPVRFCLPGDKPDTAKLGDTLTLTSDDGFVLRAVAVGSYQRWYISGDELIGTNAPEPVPTVPEPQAPTITAAAVSDALLELDANSETRLSAIEDALCDLDARLNGGVTA